MSREYTKEEVREKFINHLLHLCEYWESEERTPDTHGKMRGLLFSILSSIDGNSMDLPSFILAPLPHETDKEFHMRESNNYYPENHESDIKCDIGGSLHSVLNKYAKQFDEIKSRNEKIDKITKD